MTNAKQVQEQIDHTRDELGHAHPEPPTQDPMLWLEINDLQARYIDAIDNDQIELWPAFFTEDGTYTIVARENHDRGLPAPILKCRNQAMMRDRVVALRNANIYEPHRYRHATGGLVIAEHDGDTVRTRMSYIVTWTGQAGDSLVYQTGCYHDVVVKTPEGWRYKERTVVYDTSRVRTLLATPI
jgi:anthranilate 1,2-dioxygenase small subunit